MSEVTAVNARKRPAKRFDVGCRVSGTFGDYCPNPNPNIPRRVRARIFGNIIEAVGHLQYKVLWDDGVSREPHFSNSLRKESSVASFPPDLRPPRLQDDPELPPQDQLVTDQEAEEIDDSQRDQEPEEHLPGQRDESSDEEGGSVGEAVDEEGEDRMGQMPGQLQAENPVTPDYATKKAAAQDAIKALLGKEVLIKHKNKTVTWTVIEDWDPVDALVEDDRAAYGLTSFNAKEHSQNEVIAQLFLHLAFADWQVTLEKMNDAIIQHNNKSNSKKVKLFSPEEFLIAFGLLIGAAEYGARGSQLWDTMRDSQGGEHWDSMVPEANFNTHMKLYRFKDFRHFIPFAYKSQTLKNNNDPWWEFAEAVTEFNNIRNIRLKMPCWLSIDELMSSWKPRKTATGGLPNISFIVRKPKPLGKFFGLLSLFF
jgi:hypothetical protein